MKVRRAKVAEVTAGSVVSGFYYSAAKLMGSLNTLDRPTPIGKLCDEYAEQDPSPTFGEYCGAVGTILLYFIPFVALLILTLPLMGWTRVMEENAR